jgi:hypothetical protein
MCVDWGGGNIGKREPNRILARERCVVSYDQTGATLQNNRGMEGNLKVRTEQREGRS